MVQSQQYGDLVTVLSASFSVLSIVVGVFKAFILHCKSKIKNVELNSIISDLRSEIEALRNQQARESKVFVVHDA